MTGAASAASSAGPQGRLYVITTAAIGGGVFGFTLTGPQGAISPTTFPSGQAIRECWSQNVSATTALRIQITGTVVQSFFQYVSVQCDDGAWRTLRSVDASFDNSGGVTTWMWGVGGSPASFVAWTSGGTTRRLYLF